MSIKELEIRVTALEKRLEKLEKSASLKLSAQKDGRKMAGCFGDDDFMKGVFAEALKYREADRRKTRPREGKKATVVVRAKLERGECA